MSGRKNMIIGLEIMENKVSKNVCKNQSKNRLKWKIKEEIFEMHTT